MEKATKAEEFNGDEARSACGHWLAELQKGQNAIVNHFEYQKSLGFVAGAEWKHKQVESLLTENSLLKQDCDIIKTAAKNEIEKQLKIYLSFIEKYNKLADVNVELKSQLTKLQQENEKLKDQVAVLSYRPESIIRKELEEAKKRLLDFEGMTFSDDARLIKCKEELASVRKERDRMDIAAGCYSLEVDELKSQLTKLQQEVKEYREALEKIKVRNMLISCSCAFDKTADEVLKKYEEK